MGSYRERFQKVAGNYITGYELIETLKREGKWKYSGQTMVGELYGEILVVDIKDGKPVLRQLWPYYYIESDKQLSKKDFLTLEEERRIDKIVCDSYKKDEEQSRRRYIESGQKAFDDARDAQDSFNRDWRREHEDRAGDN